ncbi:superoxide dismutase [Micromonospora sp. Llam7]|uniref:superoxide dismutase n=1 Tax=Micromonospora tarapacensis TaxID=2835305 RepID=UPI001C83EF31|nr:superoxide dismutase [Micromonospora tarapacensis]MBX7270057.1 superoxide dismutase [Micromonospora tarapacensis]
MQRAAGIVAARQRGDLDGARALTYAFTDDAERAHAFLLPTELAPHHHQRPHRHRPTDLVREISLRIAALAAAD